MITSARRVLLLAVSAVGLTAAMPAPAAHAWVPGQAGEIAYTSTESSPGDTGYTHIWVINPDGSGRRELSHADDAYPSWSPDGRQIVFSRWEASTGYRIWIMSNTGAAPHALTPPGTPGTNRDRGNVMPRFSPDGNRIAFVSRVFDPHDNFQVWVMNADGSDAHQITDLPVTEIGALTWSPDSTHILFWAADVVNPSQDSDGNATAPYHLYEMTSEGGDLHQLPYSPGPPFLSPEGAQVGGLDWAPGRLAVDVQVDGIHVAPSDTDGSPSTWFSALGGMTADPSWSPDDPNADKIAFVRSSCNWSDITSNCTPTFQLWDTGDGRREQLTFDGSEHLDASWGPTPAHHPPVVSVPAESLVGAVDRGSRHVRVLLTCPASAGPAGCHDLLVALALSGSGSHSSKAYQVGAGRNRVVTLQLSNPLRRSLTLGTRVQLVLHARTHGHEHVVHQVARVFAPASVIGTCPAPSTQLGSSITLAGALKESPTGAHMAAAAQTQIGMVATLTNGSLSVPLTATTDPGGHYAFSFDPPEAGAWTMQVVWTGDHSHAAAYGQQCAMLVTEPPPVPAPTQTALTATCKAGTAGSPDDIGGALTPAVGGAQIKLSYERDGAPTDTITDNVTTAADGTYTDHPVPDAADTWDVTASYGGDTVHQPSVSTPCQFTVAPQQTTLALACPGKSSLNKALGISGTITPAIAGASIKLTYTHQTQGPLETFTATPTVDSTGAFSDASVTPNDPGAWKVNATYAGDNVHAPATATPCTVQIS